MSPQCEVPGRWVLDDLAARVALEAAEAEVRAAREAIDQAARGSTAQGEALDWYMLAVVERNTVRDGRP